MAENAAAADLLAGGRLQLGVSRGSPEPAWRGAEAFGQATDAEDTRQKTARFRAALAGAGVVAADGGGRPSEALLPVQPQSPGLADRIWWGSATRDTAVWTAEQGMNLMSSTLLLENTDVPFDELQLEQILMFREAWAAAGHEREPRVSVSRSVIPITSDLDRHLFGGDANEDQVGWLDGALSRFGRSYTGEPDRIADDLARDAAVQAADTVLLTVPNQSGSSTTPRCWRRSRARSHRRSAGRRKAPPRRSGSAGAVAEGLAQDPRQPEVREDAGVGEPRDGGDPVALERQHEQPVRPRDPRLGHRQVAAERRLACSRASAPAAAARRGAPRAPRRNAPIAAGPWYACGSGRHRQPGVVGQQGDHAVDVARLDGVGEAADEVALDAEFGSGARSRPAAGRRDSNAARARRSRLLTDASLVSSISATSAAR